MRVWMRSRRSRLPLASLAIQISGMRCGFGSMVTPANWMLSPSKSTTSSDHRRRSTVDPLAHSVGPLPGVDAVGGVLGRLLGVDAGTGDEDRSSAAHEVQARPLLGEQDRVAHREAGHARRAQPHPLGPAGDRGKQDDGLEAGLGQQAVTHPDASEGTARVRLDRHVDELPRRGHSEVAHPGSGASARSLAAQPHLSLESFIPAIGAANPADPAPDRLAQATW